jgi:hypothetical protein
MGCSLIENSLLPWSDPASYSIPLDTRATSNGNHILLARAYDAAGNVGPSPQITVTVSNDATPPDAPALVSPADGLVTASATPTFSWTAVSDPCGVRYRMQADDSPGFPRRRSMSAIWSSRSMHRQGRWGTAPIAGGFWPWTGPAMPVPGAGSAHFPSRPGRAARRHL